MVDAFLTGNISALVKRFLVADLSGYLVQTFLGTTGATGPGTGNVVKAGRRVATNPEVLPLAALYCSLANFLASFLASLASLVDRFQTCRGSSTGTILHCFSK